VGIAFASHFPPAPTQRTPQHVGVSTVDNPRAWLNGTPLGSPVGVECPNLLAARACVRAERLVGLR